jgi:hypothetical protein
MGELSAVGWEKRLPAFEADCPRGRLSKYGALRRVSDERFKKRR